MKKKKERNPYMPDLEELMLAYRIVLTVFAEKTPPQAHMVLYQIATAIIQQGGDPNRGWEKLQHFHQRHINRTNQL